GAAWSRQDDHTPSASSALTDGRMRAVVRLSIPPPFPPPAPTLPSPACGGGLGRGGGEGREGRGGASDAGAPKRGSARGRPGPPRWFQRRGAPMRIVRIRNTRSSGLSGPTGKALEVAVIPTALAEPIPPESQCKYGYQRAKCDNEG